MGKKKRSKPLAGIKPGERRTITRKGRKLTFEGTRRRGKNKNLTTRIVSNKKA